MTEWYPVVFHVELLTNRLDSSLLAYIAVKRMPDKIKLCKFKRHSVYLISVWHYAGPTHSIGGHGSLIRWGLLFLTAQSLLQPDRGQCPGRSEGRSILSPRTHPDSEMVWFCTQKGLSRWQTEGAGGQTSESLVGLQVTHPSPLLHPLDKLGRCHRKLSSARSLQSRHISSSSVMSSRVSPSRLAKVELLEPVSIALSSDVWELQVTSIAKVSVIGRTI